MGPTTGLTEEQPKDLLDKAGRFDKNAARAKEELQQQLAAGGGDDTLAKNSLARLATLPMVPAYDGPHVKKYLRGCANAGGIPESQRKTGPCVSFKTFAEAIALCEQTVDCGGVTQSGTHRDYELRTGGKGGSMMPSNDEHETSWLRKGFA